MEFSINDIRREYRRLDARCGVCTEQIRIVISQRAVKQLGCFRVKRVPGTQLQITIAAHVLSDESLFWQTIRHEYAHALVYLRDPHAHHGHDAMWKAACMEVGCEPQATVKLQPVKARYILRCTNCGRDYRYLRRGKAVMLAEQGEAHRLRCGSCGKNCLVLHVL